LLEQALGATEQRRATIQAELAKFDGEQPSAVIQLPPRSSGITEKLRSGVHGQVRDTIQASIAWILVGVDGSLTIEARLGGLLGVEGNVGQVGGQEDTT